MKILKKTIGGPALVLAAALVLASGGSGLAAETVLMVDSFTGPAGESGAPEGWKPLIFSRSKRPTTYTVQKESDGYALKARSVQAASGIFKEMRFDLKDYPVLTWRWKVNRVLENGNALTKAGDDYPARIYVAFEFEEEKATYFEKLKYLAARSLYGESTPGKAITYIWANRLEKDAVTPNPYLAQSMMIAVESGPEHADEWVTEERNVYEDYKKCFHSEPPRVKGVIVMTDTDNTRESAEAFYDDIVFKRRPQEHPYSLAGTEQKRAPGASAGMVMGKKAGM